MNRHSLEFDPVGRQWSWSVSSSGELQIYWTARLSRHGPKVLLSDGRDARELETSVELRDWASEGKHTLSDEAQSEDGRARGYLTTMGDRERAMFGSGDNLMAASDMLWANLNVPQETLECVLASVQEGVPPRLRIGFGPERLGFGHKELTGAITGDSSNVYHWDDTDINERVVIVMEWEFSGSQSVVPSEAPEPEQSSAMLQGLGIAFAVAANVAAIALAAAAYAALDTKFQVIVVSLLLLVYVAIANDGFILRQVLLRSELAAISRYIELRASVGVLPETAETERVKEAYAKIEQPGAKFWISAIGVSILGLMAIYELIVVLW